jgi:hypothetical protein
MGVGVGMNDMSSSTERINRVLLLWLDLQKVMDVQRQSSPRSRLMPWECQDSSVTSVWKQITDPTNQQALEEWMFQVGDGEQEVWAQHALMESRRRGKLADPSSPSTGAIRH